MHSIFLQQKLLYNYYFHNYFLDFCSFFISWNQYLVSCMLYPVSSRDGHRFCERIFFWEQTKFVMNVGVFQKKNMDKRFGLFREMKNDSFFRNKRIKNELVQLVWTSWNSAIRFSLNEQYVLLNFWKNYSSILLNKQFKKKHLEKTIVFLQKRTFLLN